MFWKHMKRIIPVNFNAKENQIGIVYENNIIPLIVPKVTFQMIQPCQVLAQCHWKKDRIQQSNPLKLGSYFVFPYVWNTLKEELFTASGLYFKAWFPYRCICHICRTKKIHRTDTTLWKSPVQMLNTKETTYTTSCTR